MYSTDQSREEYVAIQNSRHNMQAIEQNVLKKYSYPKLDVTHITACCNMRL